MTLAGFKAPTDHYSRYSLIISNQRAVYSSYEGRMLISYGYLSRCSGDVQL